MASSMIPSSAPLAQLSEQQPPEKVLLGRGRTREKLREQARSLCGGAFSPDLREAREDFVDLRKRELGRARGRGGERVFEAA